MSNVIRAAADPSAGTAPVPLDDQRWPELVSQVGVEVAEPLTAALERIHVLSSTGKIDRAGLDPELDRLGVESLYRDTEGNLWIGTAPSLFRLRPDRSIERIGPDDFVRDSWVLAIY